MRCFLRITTVVLAIGAASQAVAEFSNPELVVGQGRSVLGTRERLQWFVDTEITQLESGNESLNLNDEQMLKVLKKMRSWLAAKSGSGPGP